MSDEFTAADTAFPPDSSVDKSVADRAAETIRSASHRVSDAGEPSGTAGRPILGQIDSKELVDVLVVVVRYFGGTLLGVPGLINAYKSAASLALQMTPMAQNPVEKEYRVQFDYTQINDIMTLVKQYNCRVVQQEMQLFCNMTLAIPRNRVAEVSYKLQDMRNVEISPVTL